MRYPQHDEMGDGMSDERIFTMSEVGKSSDEAAVKTLFGSHEHSNSVVWVVKPGQEVACHKHTTSDDIWIMMQGSGLFHPEPGQDVRISAGQVIVNPAGTCHGVTNDGDEDIVFVGVIAPVPSDFIAL